MLEERFVTKNRTIVQSEAFILARSAEYKFGFVLS